MKNWLSTIGFWSTLFSDKPIHETDPRMTVFYSFKRHGVRTPAIDWIRTCSVPSGNLTKLLKMTINSGFSHEKWWFSIAMLNYQRVYVVVTDLGSFGRPSFAALPRLHSEEVGWRMLHLGGGGGFISFTMFHPMNQPISVLMVSFLKGGHWPRCSNWIMDHGCHGGDVGSWGSAWWEGSTSPVFSEVWRMSRWHRVRQLGPFSSYVLDIESHESQS